MDAFTCLPAAPLTFTTAAHPPGPSDRKDPGTLTASKPAAFPVNSVCYRRAPNIEQ